ncbi:P-loop containing nucleoside triphosphate hydrolase protein, partial [Basidiobolus meristosporus CBS 931.73]
MSNEEIKFEVLYTNQKTKKNKTWHDGKPVIVGEQLEFDRYLVTLEKLLSQASPSLESKVLPSTNVPEITQAVEQTEKLYKPKFNPRIKKGLLKTIKRDLPRLLDEKKDAPDLALSTITQDKNDKTKITIDEEINDQKPESPRTIQIPKRRRVGLSRGRIGEISEKTAVGEVDTSKDNPSSEQLHKPRIILSTPQRRYVWLMGHLLGAMLNANPSDIIKYPGKDECFKMSQNHSSVVRTRQAPTFFVRVLSIQDRETINPDPCSTQKTIVEYKNTFSSLLLDHIQAFRAKSITQYDIWAISTTIEFEPHSTFLARNVFYGPSSSGNLEIRCLSSHDISIASRLANSKSTVYAIRSFNAGNEYTMLDNLSNNLTVTPLISSILNYKVEASQEMNTPIEDSLEEPFDTLKYSMTHIDERYRVQVEELLETVIAEYSLNEDQSTKISKDMIESPENDKKSPLLLVHGAYGAGKSYLIGVLIVFLERLMKLTELNTKCPFKILVASMTNIAVDNILLGLLKLGFSDFVRVGSIKKIAKPILPYTAQVKNDPSEGTHTYCWQIYNNIKELQTLLNEETLTETEYKSVNDTIKRFTKNENKGLLKRSMVVGTTCLASTFDIFENIPFPIIILDESSQVTEPMALVPVCRFACEKLILVGDPLQLPPTLSTNSSKSSAECGLDRPLFDRLIQVPNGVERLLCHPAISALSNRLFYQSKLIDGVCESERQALVPDLPPLLFINVNGNEQQHSRSKSYFNSNEVGVVALAAKGFLEIGIQPQNIGIITLYKHQADQVEMKLKDSQKMNKFDSVQVSTVDAFQGAEKEIIIVSCVRTRQIGFIDNRQRVNVALSRAKRHLIIVGCAKLLESNPLWKTVVAECRANPNGFIHATQVPSLLKSFGCSGEFSTPLAASMNQFEESTNRAKIVKKPLQLYPSPLADSSSDTNNNVDNADLNKVMDHTSAVHEAKSLLSRQNHESTSVNAVGQLDESEAPWHTTPKYSLFAGPGLSSEVVQPPNPSELEEPSLFNNDRSNDSTRELTRKTPEDAFSESPFSVVNYNSDTDLVARAEDISSS